MDQGSTTCFREPYLQQGSGSEKVSLRKWLHGVTRCRGAGAGVWGGGGREGDACCTVILTHTRHAHRWCVVSCAVSHVMYSSHQENVSSTRVKATP